MSKINKDKVRAAIAETRYQIRAVREQVSQKPSLAYLIENSMEKASLALAAKSISDKLTKMAQDLADVEGNDLIPMQDELTSAFGDQVASNFCKTVTDAIQQSKAAVGKTREAIANEVERLSKMANGEPASDMDMHDMDSGADDMGGDLGPDMGEPDMGDDLDQGGSPPMDDGSSFGDDDMGADMGDHMGDDLGGPALTGSAAGRDRKESRAPRGKVVEGKKDKKDCKDKTDCEKVEETFRTSDNPDRIIFEAFRKAVREGADAVDAAVGIARRFQIDVSDVRAIVREGMRPFVQGGKSDRLKKSGAVVEATTVGTTGTTGTSAAPASQKPNPTGAPNLNQGSSQSQAPAPSQSGPTALSSNSAAPSSANTPSKLKTQLKPMGDDSPIAGADDYQGGDRDTLTKLANDAVRTGKSQFDVDGKRFSASMDKSQPMNKRSIAIAAMESRRK